MPPPGDKGSTGSPAAKKGGLFSAFTNRNKMGNGAGAQTQRQDEEGSSDSVSKLKSQLEDLKAQVTKKDSQLKSCEREIELQTATIAERDTEVDRLREEVHKLRSVLQQTTLRQDGPDILSTIQEDSGMVGSQKVDRNKKQGVSGESGLHKGVTTDAESDLKKFRKDSQ